MRFSEILAHQVVMVVQAVALRAQQVDRMMLSFEADTQHAALVLASWLTRMDTLLAPQRCASSLAAQPRKSSILLFSHITLLMHRGTV